MTQSNEPIEQLGNLIGTFKAEWLRERVFDLFTRPAYFPELETARPCVLVGGRGTGKTTVLRSLSYEGKFALSGRDVAAICDWTYYGFYYRVDPNRVTAFRGADLRPEIWPRLFSHYLNLLLCEQALRFALWYAEVLPAAATLSTAACRRIALSLRIKTALNTGDLLESLRDGKLLFEAYLNNLREDNLPPTSLQGAPVDELINSLASLPQFIGKHFFFLIDEFENFLDDQQVVLNTMIKHSSNHHTFKIGVRELGWRKRHTLNETEQLISPADYVRIDIEDELDDVGFKAFAADILNQRLSRLDLPGDTKVPPIETLLPALPGAKEAELLGVADRVAEKLLSSKITQTSRREVEGLPALEAFFVLFWSETHKLPVENVLHERSDNLQKWKERFENYRYALLFTIKAGRSGIQKYYVGWDTFVHLARCNIRYLLELVYQALHTHALQGSSLDQPVVPDVQTKAAEAIGRRHVQELEGLSRHGAQLTKLVLGLGRVFQVMARQLQANAPEVNQFHLIDDELSEEVAELLTAAVMHLALVRDTANKLDDSSELKDYDYALHPIFAPFFVFSYRKKRKFRLNGDRLLGIIEAPPTTIREILRANNRNISNELPEQLSLFERYYEEHPR